MNESAYHTDPAKLLTTFWKLGVEAGRSSMMIDLSGKDSATDTRYLFGILLARAENKTPPFEEGSEVRMIPTETYYCGSVNSVRYSHGEAKTDRVYTIQRIFYEEDRTWTLSFADLQQYRFPASRFEKVEKQPTVA